MALLSRNLARSRDNYYFSTITVPMATKMGRIVTYLEGLLTVYLFWSCGLARSHDKQIPSYLYCKSAYGKQTWQNDDFPWGATTYNVTWSFDHVTLWDTRFSTQTLKSSLTSCSIRRFIRINIIWNISIW